MSQNSSCALSSRYFCDLVIPEAALLRHPRVVSFYKEHPILSRLVMTPLPVLSGMIKIALFPVFCAIGIIAMPIAALKNACQGKKEPAEGRLKAWCFCILSLAAWIAFVSVVTYHLPLVASGGLLAAVMSISIAIHVYKFVKEPAAE